MTATKIVDHGRMVGLRWVCCCALLALSCGRTADSHKDSASGGSASAVGGTGSGGALGGSGPVSMPAGEAGQGGETGAPLCPVTPASGQWFARGADPYGFELTSDGSQLSGIGCLGSLPSQGDSPFGCSPLSLLADKGRSVDFVWDMSKNATTFGYVVRMELTLAPDRTAMAGTMWTSLSGALDDDGHDIVLVRYPADQPLPPATLCSNGVPSGACFLGPLRADQMDQPRVVELGGGDLLLLWLNHRGIGRRLASARFDAAAGSWQTAEFLDDGTAPVDPSRLMFTATADGWAMVAYRQGNTILARAYDRDSNTWLEQQALATSDDTSVSLRPDFLFVYEGGDATLLASAQGPTSTALSAYNYVSSTRGWEEPHLLEDSPELAPSQVAAASDAAGNAVVVTVHDGLIGEPNELWFSRRTSAGTWVPPSRLYAVDAQLLRPAVAVGKNSTAIVTWEEFSARIASSVYSFQTEAWSEPLTVTSQPNVENRAVAIDTAGAPVAYFHCRDCVSADAEQKSTFGNGEWGAPQTATAAPGDTYSVTSSPNGVEVARPGKNALPPLVRPRCEGY